MGSIVIQGVLSIGGLCLLFLAWFTLNKTRSDTYMLIAGICAAYIVSMSIFLIIFKKKELYETIWKKEGFQTAEAADVPATTFSKETCAQLKETLNNYLEVKRQHTSMNILNLDETIEQLQKYLSDYACTQYD